MALDTYILTHSLTHIPLILFIHRREKKRRRIKRTDVEEVKGELDELVDEDRYDEEEEAKARRVEGAARQRQRGPMYVRGKGEREWSTGVLTCCCLIVYAFPHPLPHPLSPLPSPYAKKKHNSEEEDYESDDSWLVRDYEDDDMARRRKARGYVPPPSLSPSPPSFLFLPASSPPFSPTSPPSLPASQHSHPPTIPPSFPPSLPPSLPLISSLHLLT